MLSRRSLFVGLGASIIAAPAMAFPAAAVRRVELGGGWYALYDERGFDPSVPARDAAWLAMVFGAEDE